MGVLSNQGVLNLYLDPHQLSTETRTRKELKVLNQKDYANFFFAIIALCTYLHLFFQLMKKLPIRRLSGDAGGTLSRQDGSGNILQALLQRDLGAV